MISEISLKKIQNSRVLMLAGFFSLVACGLQGTKNSETSNESLSYDLKFNGCSTGRHEFKSSEDYCNGLTDEKLNNGCAIDLRKDLYEKNCGKWPGRQESPSSAANRENLDIAVRRIMDKRLTGHPVRRGEEYLAFALTIKSDGLYNLEIARGFTESIDPSKGTSVGSNWSADALHITLPGVGKADAGIFNNAPGASLTITMPGDTTPISSFVWAK